MRLRPGLKEFANKMECVLQSHANLGRHWRHCDKAFLATRLLEEVGELVGMLLTEEEELGKQSKFLNYSDCVLGECCDVANFAMMIADNFGGIREKRKVNNAN